MSLAGPGLRAQSRAQFTYDANGNMTYDGLRELTIGYNCLNLPETVSESGAMKARYRYCADGTKLEAVDSLGVGYVYLGSMVYRIEGDSCSFESSDFSGGRIVAGPDGPEVRYHLTDHLGGVRCVARGEEGADGAVIYEQSDYYPFGMMMDSGVSSAAAPSNRWHFSGKEDQPLMGAHLQDFGARFYDARIARWTTIDPLADKYPGMSPYGYCGGNPVMFVNPEGREKLVYLDDKTSKNDRLRDQTTYAKDYDKILVVYAHGGTDGIINKMSKKLGASEIVEKLKNDSKLLDLNSRNGDGSVIVFNSCSTGNGKASIAAKVSGMMPESIIIAPSNDVTTYHSVSRGGRWNVFKAGVKVSSFQGSAKTFDNRMMVINKNPQRYLSLYETK